jgi:hypothetical protein
MEKSTGKAKIRGRPFEKGKPGGPGRPKGLLSTPDLRRGLQTHFAGKLDEMGWSWIDDFFTTAQKKKDSWQARKLADVIIESDILKEISASLERKRREELAFLSYRLQKDTFDIGQRILMSQEKLHIHMAGRRGGKTDTAARWLVEPLVTTDNALCLYMGLTLTKAMEQIWDNVERLVTEMGFTIAEKRRTDGMVRLSNGSIFQVVGNSSVDERSKQRGFKWHKVAIDECQSQKALVQLHDEIFGPTLLDYSGSLMFLGTGPRVRGTYWEELWTDLRSDGSRIGRGAFRLNWNAGDNPFIPDHANVLKKVREEHGWTESNSTYIREYLGQIAYDDDALVWRLSSASYFDEPELAAWIAGQPVTDVRFTAGLDYGFEDADGFAIICYSTSRPELFLVHEYKARRSGVQELADAIRKGLEYVTTSPLFKSVENKFFYVHADTGGAGKKISFDLSTQYKLPIQDAFKANKDMAIELLQDQVRRGLFKVRRGGAFDDEALKTVFARNDRDELTRIIDDETYHPDVADGILYALRPVQLFQRRT